MSRPDRILWVAPRFKEGDVVRCKYWVPGKTETVLDPDIKDGLGRYVRTSGGGTYGEGALERVSEAKTEETANG